MIPDQVAIVSHLSCAGNNLERMVKKMYKVREEQTTIGRSKKKRDRVSKIRTSGHGTKNRDSPVKIGIVDTYGIAARIYI